MKTYPTYRPYLARCVILLFATAIAPLATGADTGETADAAPNVQGVPAAIGTLIQDRKYAEAIAAIDKRIAAKQGPADY